MPKALSILRTVERTVVVAIFLIMVALYFVNVVVRATGSNLASDIAWIEEAVRTMNLYLVFLAIGLALEYGRHVAVDTWRDDLATRLGIPLRRIIDALGLVFSLYVAPMIGFALLALRYLLSLLGVIDRFKPQHAGEV